MFLWERLSRMIPTYILLKCGFLELWKYEFVDFCYYNPGKNGKYQKKEFTGKRCTKLWFELFDNTPHLSYGGQSSLTVIHFHVKTHFHPKGIHRIGHLRLLKIMGYELNTV